ncbi:MAG: phosphate ABC transporter permease subunit PstC [Acidobacteria bacterium]|nr:phosphate ABC transporter permease subunit PstC [Acidobacteriota bacterium]
MTKTADYLSRQTKTRRRRVTEWIAEKAIMVTAMVAILSIILIFLFLGRKALPVFTNESVRQTANVEEFFTRNGQTPDGKSAFIWQPISERPKYSFVPLIAGTFKATAIALLVAVPLALLGALYTSEYAPRRLREYIKPAIELLAGIPSVVLGFFALVVMASWVQKVFQFETRLNATVAGCALGLAIIPVVYTVAEDALTAVPRAMREASLALGATRAQTLLRVILPAALPGIFAGVVLGFGRAIGETMIVLMASGNAAIVSANPADSVRTMSATIAAELAEVVYGSAHYHTLFAIGVLLFIITFIINSVGDLIVRRLNDRLKGGVG